MTRTRPWGIWIAMSALAMALGCATIERVRTMPIADVNARHLPDGVYPGQFTYGGFTYTVAVQVAAGRMTAIEVTRNRDSHWSRKAEGVVAGVLAAQHPNVDAISGATTTSKALLKAIENALTTADRR